MNAKESVNVSEPSENLAEGGRGNTEPHFFSTSVLKLVLMSICTFGIYELYWFYKNWTLIKERTGENIMPFWRAFFAPLWAYSCFKHIGASVEENNVQESFSFSALGILYLILKVSWRLPDPFWLISFFSFMLIVPVNRACLEINKKLISDFKNNEKFSGWNWLCLALGGLLFLMSLISLFLPQR